MINLKHFKEHSPLPKLWTWILVMMMSAHFMSVQAADWMRDASKFSMENHTDHVTLKIFMCDLDRTNTYAKSGGVYATCGGQRMWLLDLWYINEGSDENPFGKVRARYCIGEERAWFTNGYGQKEQEIGFSAQDFLLQKWGSDNHYLTTALDLYYPASMAGKTWTFYYEYTHNDGDKLTRTLGTAYLSNTLGLSHFDTNKYKVERTKPDKIQFTVPALPDDVDSKLKEVHIHEGIYNVKFTYTKQDNKKIEKSDTLICEKGMTKTYDLDIPEEAGNPKQIDMSITATDGLRDAKNYYWKTTNSYSKSNIFPTVPIPSSLKVEYRQFDKAADLSWSAFPADNSNLLECTPYIYRIETDKNGEPLYGSWSKRGFVDNEKNNQALGYHDVGLQQENYYKYRIVNVPKSWIGKGITESLLNNPDDALLNKLGYVESGLIQTKPSMTIYGLKQDETVTDKVKLTWQYSRVPTTSSSVKFQVMRKTDDGSEWAEYGSVTGDAEPKSNSFLSFEDKDLPNASVRYQYMIRLSLNNGNSVFESNPIYAGLLSGSMVKTFEATRGTHENTVRLTWTAKQVGTDNTTYDISRRYIGTNGDFIKINTTTGTAARYTYEDNTVQPGYYYEYKIEAYSGNVLQNSLTDAGFCQARGVISGRVTFGTGTAVEDVRITLRASDTGDDNSVKGYALHVDGASTGITWDADSAAIEKVFGADKDYTVQMFVRPGADLNEGAVIAEIPNIGRLRVGSRQGDGYKLIVEKYTEVTVSKKVYKEYWKARSAIIDTKAKENGEPGYYYEPYDSYIYTTEESVASKRKEIIEQFKAELGDGKYNNNGQWIADKYGGSDYYCSWYFAKFPLPEEISVKNVSWQGMWYDAGLTVPANVYSLITLQNDGNAQTVYVGDSISTISSQQLLSTKSYSKSSSNLPENYQQITINGNFCLYVTENSNSASLMATYEKAKTMFGQASLYFPNTAVENVTESQKILNSFSVGGTKNIENDEAFRGEITEVRVWNHILTDKEQKGYADRILNGRESGLALYWPMDEGLERYVFDASYADDLPNGRHATVGNNISVSTMIPADHQLSRYTVTNGNGEFILRGIPFVGSGSTYTVIPTRGIHDFSPTTRNGFIGNGSLTLNNYDFIDVSSFPVRGKVTYLNTNIPADSIQFKIDGNPVQVKDQMVKTDANGEYEISVPIGEHIIEAYLDGHRLNSFPADGSKYDFKRAETVNFTDSTLVNVTGRINGGFSDMEEPVGFNRSVNRLGKATIKLSLGRESQCSFNYIVDDHDMGSFGTKNIPVESASENIQSTAYRAGGKQDDTNYIYITTDERNGEFSALLPPLKYKVESIIFKGGEDYNNEPVFAQNLPIIDATAAADDKLQCDSIVIDGVMQKYRYSAKMIRQHRTIPTITVVQPDMKNGAFGESRVPVFTLSLEKDTIDVIKYTDKGYNYTFGYPIFRQNQRYGFEIDVAEMYKNLDNGETYKEIPRDARVSILNDASMLTSVSAEKAVVNGKEIAPGTDFETANIEIIPDSTGHVYYEFVGGWPYLGEGNIRNMSIGVIVDGRTTMWQAPNSKTEALDLILLGNLPTGFNFMTDGVDKVDYILRRPPGSTSVASLETTTLDSYTSTSVDLVDNYWGGGTYVSLAPTFEIAKGVSGIGLLILDKSKWQIVANHTVTRVNGHKDSDYSTDKEAYTFTEKVSTPNSIPYSVKHGDFRPESGDTYIGHSTNYIFSKTNSLNIYQQDDGSYKIQQKDGIGVSEQFKTKFTFTQEYIEDFLIPNWEAYIRDRLIHVNGNHWDENNSEVKKVPGEVRYYTSYKPEDPEYGKGNGDPYWGKKYMERNHFPSYRMVSGIGTEAIDEVEHAINQIVAWKHTIASNENDKLRAFDEQDLLENNHSISGGTTVSLTSKTEKTHSSGIKRNTYHTVNNESKLGTLFNNAGAYGILKFQDGWGEEESGDTTHVKSTTVSWTLSDGDPRTALSVDVYKSPNGWGPIFRTRGGQTVNPYEGQTETIYNDRKGTLNEATMHVELPQLKVDGAAEQTNIPTGGEARFTLKLFNASETNSYCSYVLKVKEDSNPDGAQLFIDGTSLSGSGRAFKIAGGEEITKMLVVKQSDRSITDYRDIILQLKSEKDASISSDPVTLHVQFVPASARIELAVNHTVLNKADKDSLGGIIATMEQIDRQDEGLLGVRLRYRRKGVDTWNVLQQWATKDSLIAVGYLRMFDGSSHEEKVTFLDDGIYELQAQTFGKYGPLDVTYESNIIEVTQDTHGPKILGMISPKSGQLTYLNRNNMHLRFNEQLNGNALSKMGNISIVGGMNNVVFGQNVYPDVAVQLNGNRIETEALYDLSNTDYAFDMWFYRQGDGTIISVGTDNNLLALSTHDNGMLRARVGDVDDIYETNVQLPAEKWVYMALNYKRKTSPDDQNRITMLYATSEDNVPNYVGKDVPAKDLNGHGKLGIGGDGMQGMIAELSIWNSDITTTQLYETRTMARASYTQGLVGYWNMTEGHGTKITDVARSRHMYMPSESWYINNENRAARLSGKEGSPLKIDISTFIPGKNDNFAYEMWFRGNKENNTTNNVLMSVMNNTSVEYEVVESPEGEKTPTKVTTETESVFGFENGVLKMKLEEYTTTDNDTEQMQVKSETVLSENNYLDGNWHHLAFNVRRGTSAIVYIDGEAVKVLPENYVPGFNSRYLVVGGELAGGKECNRFTGDVDDIRIWSAALDGKLIRERMYERMNDGYSGLVGYFPMEEIKRENGTIKTNFNTGNFGERDSRLKIENQPEMSNNAPALKPGSSKIPLADTDYDFTTSADEIYFTFYDNSLPLMDNNDFVVTVNNIKDEHGNSSEPVMWMFHTNFASVSWDNTLLNPSVSLTKYWDQELEFVAPIYNTTGMPQTYEITGMPSWMTVEEPVGTIDSDYKYLKFHIDAIVPIGKYTEYIYVTDRLGIRRVLQVNLTVQGDEPNWNVDKNLYESNMMMTGQVYIGDKISENTDTKIAAFDDMGLCRGVAYPRYVKSRDAYYVDMIVYGASATDISSGQQELTLKMYDASTGNIYPVVDITMPDGSTGKSFKYIPDASIGSYDSPVILRSTDDIQEPFSLPRGWSWMSIYVNPSSSLIGDVLPKNKSDLKKFQNVKGKTQYASARSDGSEIIGSLQEIVPGNMYKVQLTNDCNFNVYGSIINVLDNAQTIYPNYNWIGTLSNKVMSLEDAFADLAPEKGDRIKNRTAQAEYRGNGIWEGTLKSIVPGEGYIYFSKASTAKTFHYPLLGTNSSLAAPAKMARIDENVRTHHYNVVDSHLYPDNMTITAVVEKDGERVTDAEVGTFIGDECRGAVFCNNGYYFLTIMGSAEMDADNYVDLYIYIDGDEYVIKNVRPFVSDAFIGSLDEPYVLDLNTTGIRTIDNDDDDTEWYTLQGYKIGRKPNKQGVYIHRGKKVVLREKRYYK